MLDMETKGLKRVVRALQKLDKQYDNLEKFYRKVGQKLRSDFTRNMTRGVDPDGKPLAPVAIWTRAAGITAGGGRIGKPTPLLNTGALRAAMGVQSVSGSKLEFGFQGKFLRIANNMVKGRPGFMRVRQKRVENLFSGVQTTDDGSHDYVRINTAVGWRTKRVQPGPTIRVNPRKRNFFFLSNKQEDEIFKMIEDEIARINAA